MSSSDTPSDRSTPQPGDAPQEQEKTRLTDGQAWTEQVQPNAAPPTTHEPLIGTANTPFGPGNVPPGPKDLPQSLQGRYRLIRVLGTGGFANVYLAHDTVLDQPVAIKVLRLGLTTPSDRDRFLMEARIGAKLRHPNIVTVFDIIQSADGLQMVMEYYPGGTLTERIRAKGPLPVREAVDITRQIAQALAYAHRHNVIHRDVKPANVFLAGEGMVKLGDFGIAAHSDRHEFTQTGMIIGTPLYMPPEQSADSRDVDPRTDIYALGLSLYHMLTGRPPRVVDLESIPETFRRLIKQATAPERSERLVSCEQFIAMLDQVQCATPQARRVAEPHQAGSETELDAPALPTASTATQTGRATSGATPDELTSTQGPEALTPPPQARSINADQAAKPLERVKRSVWPIWLGLVAVVVAAAAVAFVLGVDWDKERAEKQIVESPASPVTAATQGNTSTPVTSNTQAAPATHETPRPFRDRLSRNEGLPLQSSVSTQTAAQRSPLAAQALLKGAAATPVVPTPAPTPTATATAPRSLGEEFERYLKTNPGIASAVEILREGDGAGKPDGMRAFEIRQAQATLVDAIKKTPNDPLLNLIVGNMLQKSGRGTEAAYYFERAVLLDKRAGSPLGLSLAVIRDYLARMGSLR